MKHNHLIFSAVVTTALVMMCACGGKDDSPKTVTLTTLEDSINYTLGVNNGGMIKQREFVNDSSKNAAANFIKGMDKAFNTFNGKSEVYMQGYSLGQWLKEQDKGILENSNYKFDINLLKQGLTNAFLKYKDSAFSEASTQNYVQMVFNKIQQAKYKEEMQKQQQLQQMQTQPADTAKKADIKAQIRNKPTEPAKKEDLKK
ncbi:MAG: hypothetical protein FWD66_05460 [Paludibacter sp.]|nr:hypothetical protein [Paludibacter sp.]